MKKSELSFKVAALTDDRRLAMFHAMSASRVEFAVHEKSFIYCHKGLVSAGSCVGEFDKNELPEMSLAEAIKLIESIEPDAPEFDIKPFDRVLMRNLDKVWSADFFNLLSGDEIDFVSCQAKECIKYDGNEKYHGTTYMPPGWWECENGKPVWRTK